MHQMFTTALFTTGKRNDPSVQTEKDKSCHSHLRIKQSFDAAAKKCYLEREDPKL